MYKIFEVTYNDGDWHSGGLPHFFYIAKSEEEVITNSKEYKEYLELNELRDNRGVIWIHETSGLEPRGYFENLVDFDIEVTVRKK